METNEAIKTLKDHKICFEHDFGWNRTVLDALDTAIEALAADVVPVVRCGECKYSAVDFENMRYCKLVTYYNHVPDDWFCADGEKRADNG